MSAKRKPVPVALGFRAERGGAVVVAVAVERGAPRVVMSTFLATAEEGDRLSLEPYHVAAGMKRGVDGKASKEAVAAVARGRKKQDRLAAKGLEAIVLNLGEEGFAPKLAALLVNRAGWIKDLLSYSLEWDEHAPVAEGLAVRDALRFAFGEVGLKAVEVDEKSLREVGSKDLGVTPDEVDARLKALGATAGKPWRREQKLACLAAWLALA